MLTSPLTPERSTMVSVGEKNHVYVTGPLSSLDEELAGYCFARVGKS